MELLLRPSSRGDLGKRYKKALAVADEVWILSAFLTNWDDRLVLSPSCSHITFIIGTWQYITAPSALRQVLRWLQEQTVDFSFLCVPSDIPFHPKMLLSKTGSDYEVLIGSSNLTIGGQTGGNIEANVHIELPANRRQQLLSWIDDIANLSLPLTEEWLEDYSEEHQRRKSIERLRKPIRRNSTLVLGIPETLPEEFITDWMPLRRQQVLNWQDYGRAPFESIVRAYASERNEDGFYPMLQKVWFPKKNEYRFYFQRPVWTINARNWPWREACQSVVDVLDAESDTEAVVYNQLVHLHEQKNPARAAWFSEVLCLLYPEFFPVWNATVTQWLKLNDIKGIRKGWSPDGYFELARYLRRFRSEFTAQTGTVLRDLADVDLWIRYRVKPDLHNF